MDLSPEMASAMHAFAAKVGEDTPVAVLGSGSRGDLGGALLPGTQVLRAPSGTVEHRRDELTVSVAAGTALFELESVLQEGAQTTGLATEGSTAGGTVGSAVATATGGLHGLRFGHMRDAVLGIAAVNASGSVVRAGGSTVKNVSGFDLCRLFTGSLGTLALIGALTLRTRPLPRATRWVRCDADPFEVAAMGGCVTSVLWDGSTTWLHLAGHQSDISTSLRSIESRCRPAGEGIGVVEGPPALPTNRWSVDPASLPAWSTTPPTEGPWVAEVGVGTVHVGEPHRRGTVPERLATLNRAIKDRFDPGHRFAPGRSPLGFRGATT
ncbi:MAG: FAD-binding protein [Microthrixaceae bacterium]